MTQSPAIHPWGLAKDLDVLFDAPTIARRVA